MTRIQSKSRPTKRPQAILDPITGTWSKTPSGRPRTDKKGFPQTSGIPLPVLVNVNASAPPPPDGYTAIGTGWRYSAFASTTPGAISNDGAGDLTVAVLDGGSTDVQTELESLNTGDILWLGSDYGEWEATITTVVPQTGVVIFVVEFEDEIGLPFQPNQPLRLYYTTP